MNKTTNKYSPEVRERAARMVLDNQGQHESRWSFAWQGIAEGNVPRRGDPVNFIEDRLRTTNAERMGKKVEVDNGQRGGVTTEMAEKMKALEREVRELKQANEILRKASAYFAPPLGDCVAITCRATGRSSTARSNDDPVHRRSPCRSWGRANLPCSADCPSDVP